MWQLYHGWFQQVFQSSPVPWTGILIWKTRDGHQLTGNLLKDWQTSWPSLFWACRTLNSFTKMNIAGRSAYLRLYIAPSAKQWYGKRKPLLSIISYCVDLPTLSRAEHTDFGDVTPIPLWIRGYITFVCWCKAPYVMMIQGIVSYEALR